METGLDLSRSGNGGFSHAAVTLISRLAPLLNRPLLLSGGAVLASFFCCGALAQAMPVSEVNQPDRVTSNPSSSHLRSAEQDQVPPLVLGILGLAALALSQTRGTENIKPVEAPSCTGKNVPHGQKLPKIRKPQPVLPPLERGPSGVIAREHHDDVMGFEPIGGFRMLHK